MILRFEDTEEFLKFVKTCERHRFQLYFIAEKSQFMLRPTKSSKNLDTAMFTGKSRTKDFRETLFELFPEKDLISVSEISFMKE